MDSNRKTASIANMSQRKAARIAGFLGLTIWLGPLALVIRQSLIVPGDVAATVNNIMANEGLFRIAIVSDLTMQVFWCLLMLALYVLLKPVNKNLASLFMLLGLLIVPIAMLNALNDFAALQLLSGADYLTVFEADQLHAQVMFFLDLHKTGVSIAGIFMGLWLFPFGYLVSKSGYFPRILGVLCIITGFGYVIDSFAFFLFNSEAIISLFTFIGEVVFLFWLVLKGAKIPEMKS
jgi:hypothetical protein